MSFPPLPRPSSHPYQLTPAHSLFLKLFSPLPGPNNVSYTLSSNGTDPLYYDVFLQTLVFSTGQTYTTLTRQNQPIANGQWINVTVFPGEMVNETRKELSYEESYSVRIEGHVRRNTTAEEGESQDVSCLTSRWEERGQRRERRKS